MPTSTIFFSYGRENSAFVLDLAKELRKAGANIWLDQLDIEPGARWDRSIEKALKASDTLMVILSKDSVESHNVMDEVSYALEEHKKVVPVLMEACEIPFRLRRLQYADFTKNHQTGIATLIKALQLDRDVASRLTDIAETDHASIKEDIDKINKIRREQDTKLKQDRLKKEAEERAARQREKDNHKQKPQPVRPIPKKSTGMSSWLIAGIILAVIGAILFVLFIIGLAMETEGGFTDTNDTFNTIENPITPVSTTTYASDWNLALNTNTPQIYATYINYYGKNNEHYSKALSNLKGLLKNKGYMQYATADGQVRYFDKVSPNIVDGYPEANDIARTIAPGYLWTAVPGDDPYAEQTGYIHPAGQIVFVMDVVYSGNIPWVYVMY